MNFVEIHFVILPCGCVIATDIQPVGEYLECYWCGDTFSMRDIREWFYSASRMVLLERSRVLVKADSKLFEVIDQCDDCGVPLVREKNAKDNSVIHVSRLSNVEQLSN